MVADIRKLMEATPFVPFTIYLADGRQLRVPTMHHIAVPPAGSRVFVFGDDEGYTVVSPQLISGIVENRHPTAEELRRLLKASPFSPFTIYTGEKAFLVPIPQFAWLSPRGRTLIVGNAPDKGFDIVDVPLISRIEIHDPTKSAS
jgi:hypothetical protein